MFSEDTFNYCKCKILTYQITFSVKAPYEMKLLHIEK